VFDDAHHDILDTQMIIAHFDLLGQNEIQFLVEFLLEVALGVQIFEVIEWLLLVEVGDVGVFEPGEHVDEADHLAQQLQEERVQHHVVLHQRIHDFSGQHLLVLVCLLRPN